MNQTRDDLDRLASYVVSARVRAGFATRKELAAATGVSARTLGKLENAEAEVSPDTLARVADAVGWTPDSPRLVMSGGEPRPRLAAVPGPPLPEGFEGAPAKVLDLVRAVPPSDWPWLADIWALPAWHFTADDRYRMMQEWAQRDDAPQGERHRSVLTPAP